MEYTGGLWTLSLGLPPPYATLMVRKASPSPPSRAKTWQVGQDPASVPEDGGDANARSTGAAHQAAVAPSYTTVELDEAGAAVPQLRQHLILCHLHLHHHHHLHRPQLNVNPTPPQPANLSKLDVEIQTVSCFRIQNLNFKLLASHLLYDIKHVTRVL